MLFDWNQKRKSITVLFYAITALLTRKVSRSALLILAWETFLPSIRPAVIIIASLPRSFTFHVHQQLGSISARGGADQRCLRDLFPSLSLSLSLSLIIRLRISTLVDSRSPLSPLSSCWQLSRGRRRHRVSEENISMIEVGWRFSSLWDGLWQIGARRERKDYLNWYPIFFCNDW